ncbi:hypothetical protein B0J12DRAFT_7143 [Macrophomina phaseolina]|uniref:Uncharacterized protein n=1 Tax=Macrophomina phaseolina TaxID=35725 RepID=A0ABQ8GTS6_9PEZI|nr:hypothetical protein B0J12DRAFT_7143 [Macrophomina phaseolina]
MGPSSSGKRLTSSVSQLTSSFSPPLARLTDGLGGLGAGNAKLGLACELPPCRIEERGPRPRPQPRQAAPPAPAIGLPESIPFARRQPDSPSPGLPVSPTTTEPAAAGAPLLPRGAQPSQPANTRGGWQLVTCVSRQPDVAARQELDAVCVKTANRTQMEIPLFSSSHGALKTRERKSACPPPSDPARPRSRVRPLKQHNQVILVPPQPSSIQN